MSRLDRGPERSRPPIATVSSQFAVQPGRIPVGMMSLWITMPLAIGSVDPARIGESSHSS